MKENPEKVKGRKQDRAVKGQPDYGCVPSFFWYRFFGSGIVINIARLVFGMKIKTDKRIKNMEGPLVIVGNHPSYIDPIIMGTTVYGRPINFVAGNFLFRNKVFGHIITKGGCIPKAQYRNDMRTVRAMFRVLSRGGVLGIFPEATRMVDGHSIWFDSGLASVVKKSGAGLAILRTHGAYMTWPRWSRNSWRKGKITAEYVYVLTKEEAAEMTVEEIHQAMLSHMEYDEYEYFRNHPQVFRSKAPADGVENVACLCPKCEGKKEDGSRLADRNTMRSDGHVLRCISCGNQVKMDKYGFFSAVTEKDKCFPDLHAWHTWEESIYARDVEDPDFTLKEDVTLFQPVDEYDNAKVGSGTITIANGTITFDGQACAPEDGIIYRKGKPIKAHKNRDIISKSSPVQKQFSIASMKGVLYDFGQYFELYESGGQVYRFYPKNTQRIHEINGIIQAMKNQK